MGKLADSANAVKKGIRLARKARLPFRKWRGLAYQAWGTHLLGKLDAASVQFRKAEQAQRQDSSKTNLKYLCDLWGIWHADHLRRRGNKAYARHIIEQNLEWARSECLPEIISQSRRVLGDLDADEGNHDIAWQSYDEALTIARRITHSQVLIEALIGRGRWAARYGDLEIAHKDLDEALRHALSGCYRIFEADIRVGLAWMHVAEKDLISAQQQVEQARNMSIEMGYHWGQVDVAEIPLGPAV